jgi:hypothetical protein
LAMVFRKPGPEITRRCEAHYFHHSFEAISNKVLGNLSVSMEIAFTRS